MGIRKRLAKLTEYNEVVQAERLLNWYDADGPIDFISRTARGTPDPFLTRTIIGYFNSPAMDLNPDSLQGDDTFSIEYSFPHHRRPNRFPSKGGTAQYGDKHWSYRMLYDFLCRTFNGGEYFIDEYFNRLFENRPVHERFLTIQQRVKQGMAAELKERKGGLLEKATQARLRNRQGQFSSASQMQLADYERELERFAEQGWGGFSVFREPILAAELRQLSKDIRDDIETCMTTGDLPFYKTAISEETKKRRLRFPGFDYQTVFLASGSLISNLQIHINLDSEAA
jgi:hypothetical protein